MSRSRLQLAAVAVVLILAGLSSRRWPEWQPPVVAAYAGDVLWAMLAFTLVAFMFPRLTTGRVLAITASIAFAVESSQLLHTTDLDAFRMTRVGALAVGQGFLWSDVACYGLGVVVAALVDRSVGRLWPGRVGGR